MVTEITKSLGHVKGKKRTGGPRVRVWNRKRMKHVEACREDDSGLCGASTERRGLSLFISALLRGIHWSLWTSLSAWRTGRESNLQSAHSLSRGEEGRAEAASSSLSAYTTFTKAPPARPLVANATLYSSEALLHSSAPLEWACYQEERLMWQETSCLNS